MRKECIFCFSSQILVISTSDRLYWSCLDCGGIFLDHSFLPEKQQECDRYCLHKNSVEDPGYIAWLNRFFDGFDVFCREREGLDFQFRSILDWGSGPYPALAKILTDRSYSVFPWDPFFQPILPDPGTRFGAITCLEVAEHFHNPRKDFSAMAEYLPLGGYLAVGTRLLESMETVFDRWWYRQDSTHVSFYSLLSLQIVAESAGLEYLGKASEHVCVFIRR